GSRPTRRSKRRRTPGPSEGRHNRSASSLVLLRRRLDAGERHRGADGVAQPQLEAPLLRPVLLLLVLAHLQQDYVAALLQGAARGVLVDEHAVVVLLAGEDLLAVEEDLQPVDAAGAQLDEPLLRRLDEGGGVGDGAL